MGLSGFRVGLDCIVLLFLYIWIFFSY